MNLESIASKFEFPIDGALFIIAGPHGVGKSSVIKNPSLLISAETDINEIESKMSKFLTIEHRLAQIVLDEINPRFYKTNYFKTVYGSCKETNLQLFIIVTNIVDLPPLVRAKADYWFLFKLDNTILGFPPLNQLSNWKEPEHDEFTAIVAQFSDSAKPEIWWYNSNKAKKSKTTTKTIKIIKNGDTNSSTNIMDLLAVNNQLQSDSKSSEDIRDLERRIKQLTKEFVSFQESINSKFERLFKGIADLDTKLESIMYEEN